MDYIVEAFSWGSDLIHPDIKKNCRADIQEARTEMKKQWENPQCFHVRILTLIDTDSVLEHHLHCMKSRPTKDRELRLFFENIVAPHGVETIHRIEKVNVLRVLDFPNMVPVSDLRLPADKFYYNIMGTNRDEIELRRTAVGSQALKLDSFQVCIAAAAFYPSATDALLGIGDESFHFLSEVEIDGRTAELTFDLMDVGQDFIQ